MADLPPSSQDLPDQGADLRQRVAEAIAEKFTYPVHRCDRDGENERVENAEPADRIDQTPYVMGTAGDGCRSFWTPTCAELAEVVAAVRDEEMYRLRQETASLFIGADPSRVAAGKRIVDSLTRLVGIERDDARADRDRWRERAERAEAELASAQARIDRVKALHKPLQPPEGHQWLTGGREPKCEGCDTGDPYDTPEWPCDTIRALDDIQESQAPHPRGE